jgi:hypothetical protein
MHYIPTHTHKHTHTHAPHSALKHGNASAHQSTRSSDTERTGWKSVVRSLSLCCVAPMLNPWSGRGHKTVVSGSSTPQRAARSGTHPRSHTQLAASEYESMCNKLAIFTRSTRRIQRCPKLGFSSCTLTTHTHKKTHTGTRTV